MTYYIIYIRIFLTRKETFSVELQEIKFFLKYFKAIAKIESEYAQEIKKRDNQQIGGQGKNKIDNLAKPVNNQNAVRQHSKAS